MLYSQYGSIPPKRSKHHIDMNCQLDRGPMNVFAYRVHTHRLGSVLSAYRFSLGSEKWDLIAKGNPQWPQAFYPLENVMRINRKDIIAARCTYNSSNKSIFTNMGSTANDEMCNIYLMYYTENPFFSRKEIEQKSSLNDFNSNQDTCEGLEFEELKSTLPDGNDEPLPRNLTLELSAAGQHSGHSSPKHSAMNFVQDSDWPLNFGFGQITAVDFDLNDNIVVFHRGDHVWNENTFDISNHYRLIERGPISSATIVTIDSGTGEILDQWGNGLFFLPHGLTLDNSNRSVWLTDVAMHQVFKFSIDKKSTDYKKLVLSLGERFQPGKDKNHFCKPTSVAIDHFTGQIFVADGYCNSRIIRFSSEGKYIDEWGHESGTAPFFF